MERTMSVEEKIRRAEEIYARRMEGIEKRTATVTVNNESKKDVKLLKKMIIQIILSLFIYLIIYIVQKNNYIFSEDFINKANEILSYDMNFVQIYENIKQNIEQSINEIRNKNNEGAIGGAEENMIGEDSVIQGDEQDIDGNSDNTEESVVDGAEDNIQILEQSGNIEQLSQEEQDVVNTKLTTTFIKPVEGIITSGYGQRETTISSIPKNHTGVDIAANTGTKIISATDGEVVLASEEGDYGKHLKIQIGDVSIIYAHCNDLYVEQGDIISQGQEIAEVGSTGNSTGPHLHFEVRISERTIDPQKILEL